MAAQAKYHLTLGLKGMKVDGNVNEANRAQSSRAVVPEQPLHIE